jgi:hypothetical protein
MLSYKLGHFEEAQEVFGKCYDLDRKDSFVLAWLERCKLALVNKPASHVRPAELYATLNLSPFSNTPWTISKMPSESRKPSVASTRYFACSTVDG